MAGSVYVAAKISLVRAKRARQQSGVRSEQHRRCSSCSGGQQAIFRRGGRAASIERGGDFRELCANAKQQRIGETEEQKPHWARSEQQRRRFERGEPTPLPADRGEWAARGRREREEKLRGCLQREEELRGAGQSQDER